MSKITKVHARQVFDSRGNPTIEAEVTLENNIKVFSIVPSGASTGAFEAYELRDNNKDYFLGKSVLKAVNNVNTIISQKIINQDPSNQKKIDDILLNLDGTDNKKNLGANSLLAVSLAVRKAAIILNKENYQIKKWGHKKRIQKGDILFIPPYWSYIQKVEKGIIQYHIDIDTYFTFLPNLLKEIYF